MCLQRSARIIMSDEQLALSPQMYSSSFFVCSVGMSLHAAQRCSAKYVSLSRNNQSLSPNCITTSFSSRYLGKHMIKCVTIKLSELHSTQCILSDYRVYISQRTQ